jgi:hypothetical protein
MIPPKGVQKFVAPPATTFKRPKGGLQDRLRVCLVQNDQRSNPFLKPPRRDLGRCTHLHLCVPVYSPRPWKLRERVTSLIVCLLTPAWHLGAQWPRLGWDDCALNRFCLTCGVFHALKIFLAKQNFMLGGSLPSLLRSYTICR